MSYHQMFRQTSSPAAQANESVLPTAIYKPVLTCATVTIVDDGRHYDSTADFESFGNTFSHLFNHSAELVSERKRYCFSGNRVWFAFRTQRGPTEIFVKVRSTLPSCQLSTSGLVFGDLELTIPHHAGLTFTWPGPQTGSGISSNRKSSLP